MNKQDLISKIAQDTGITKANAAAAVDSFIEGITKSLKKGAADHLRRVRHVQDGAAEGAHRAQPADRRRNQDSEAPRGPFQRRQGAQAVTQLEGRKQTPVDAGEAVSSASPLRFLIPCAHACPVPASSSPFSLVLD